MRLEIRTILAGALALSLSWGCGEESDDDGATTGLPTDTSGDGDGDGGDGDGDGGDGDGDSGDGDGDSGDGDSGDGDRGDGDGDSGDGDGDTGGDASIADFCDTACNDCFMGTAPWKMMPADQCVNECIADFEDCDQADLPEIMMCTGGDGCPVGMLEFGFCVAPFTCLL